MSMTKHTGNLPRPAADLERLAGYYDTHDTSAEMEHGERVEPQPMASEGNCKGYLSGECGERGYSKGWNT